MVELDEKNNGKKLEHLMKKEKAKDEAIERLWKKETFKDEQEEGS